MYVMKLKYLIAPFVLAAAALCGCQETAEIHPVAYMTDAQKTVSKSVTIDTPGRNGDFGLLFGARE